MTPWTVACQSPLSLGFPRQEYWSGLPFSTSGDLSDPGINPVSPVLQADSLPLSHLGSPVNLLAFKHTHTHTSPINLLAFKHTHTHTSPINLLAFKHIHTHSCAQGKWFSVSQGICILNLTRCCQVTRALSMLRRWRQVRAQREPCGKHPPMTWPVTELNTWVSWTFPNLTEKEGHSKKRREGESSLLPKK